MKKWIAMMTIAALAAACAPSTHAGDREWATAGKVLTGVLVGAAVVQALQPPPPCVPAAPVVYAPAPPTVVVAPPAPPPVVYVPAPVVCVPRPVRVYHPVVWARPAPVVTVRFHHCHGR